MQGLNFKKYRFEFNILIHLVAGGAVALAPLLMIPWALGALVLYGWLWIIATKNRGGQAHFAAAYFAGIEMLSRLSKSGLPYEMTKYGVILLLITGLLFDRSYRPKPYIIIFYFLLLLPSILVIQAEDLNRARIAVLFNLSGPLCLAVSTYYFYYRSIDYTGLTKLLRLLLLPIMATVGYLFIGTPSLSQIEFSNGANFEASGGFGPNQMSSVLGIGILVIAVGYLFRLRMFHLQAVALACMVLLAYRGLLTFSRGGLVGPIIILIVILFYYAVISGAWQKIGFSRLLAIGLLGAVFYFTFHYINEKSDNQLWERFSGERKTGRNRQSAEDISSGRTKIAQIDWLIFTDHPFLGVGPGMANAKRVEYGYPEKAAAHIEQTRLLAEHGILGLSALLILLFFPVSVFLRRRRLDQRLWLIVGVGFCLFFMLHSATRIALPMFLYGLAFIWLLPWISNTKSSLFKKHPTAIVVSEESYTNNSSR